MNMNVDTLSLADWPPRLLIHVAVVGDALAFVPTNPFALTVAIVSKPTTSSAEIVDGGVVLDAPGLWTFRISAPNGHVDRVCAVFRREILDGCNALAWNAQASQPNARDKQDEILRAFVNDGAFTESTCQQVDPPGVAWRLFGAST